MFPPNESQQWNPDIPWIPIPVFSKEELDDVSIKFSF
jgi:hypothetical protein